MTDPRLCLALDGFSTTEALEWVRRAAPICGVFKIGLELFTREGPAIVHRCRQAGAHSIFLDLKLHDIPRTVGRAVAAIAEQNVQWLTLHLGGGAAMVQAAQAAAPTGLNLLGVTVLTSLDDTEASLVGLGPLTEVVQQRTQLAEAVGIAGIVCSVHEVKALKTQHQNLKYTTPGIRWPGGSAQDQRRVASPQAAISAGADLLVIGRMVTQASDPEAALMRLARAMT